MPLLSHNFLCLNIFAEHLLRMNLLVSTHLSTGVLLFNQNCTVPCVFSVLVESIRLFVQSWIMSQFVLERIWIFSIVLLFLQFCCKVLFLSWPQNATDVLSFYQAHSTWLKFQFTGRCVPDKLQCDVLQFTRYNILSTGQTLSLHVMIFEYN